MDLKNMALLKGLSKKELAGFEKFAKPRDFEKGETLFMEGDPPSHLWFILEGEVKVFKEFASGKSAILGIFGGGSVIAEIPVIDGKSYPATCQAVTAGRAALVERKKALHAITSSPTVSLRLMIGIGNKLRELTGDLGSMAVQSVIKRLSRFLLKIAERMGKPDGDTIVMTLPLTRKDIAECIGTSFEVAIRALGKLQDDKVLEIQGKELRILNRQKLRKMAEDK